MKQLSIILLLLVALLVCCQSPNSWNEQTSTELGDLEIKIDTLFATPTLDTLYVDFKLVDENGEKAVRNILGHQNAAKHIRVTENGGVSDLIVHEIRDITNLEGKNIFLLFDESKFVPEEAYDNQYEVLKKVCDAFGEASINMAVMIDSTIPKTISIKNPDSCGAFFTSDDGEIRGRKRILSTVKSKMNELSKEDVKNTYLIVFTDGDLDEESTELALEFRLRADSLNSMPKDSIKAIPIFCFYMNPFSDTIDNQSKNILKFLSSGNGARFEVFNIDSLSTEVVKRIDSIAPDYRLVLKNRIKRKYDGSRNALEIAIALSPKDTVFGGIDYAFGSPQNTRTVELSSDPKTEHRTLWLGLLGGVIALGISYLIMRLAIPAISFALFKKRYQKKYTGESGTMECYLCTRPIKKGQMITTHCDHTMHWECLEDNNCLCPQCSHRKSNYYNKKNLWDPLNFFPVMRWILWGMIAGLVSWVFFRLFWTPTIFGNIVFLMNSEKLQENLLCGIVMGFFVIYGLSYVLDYRKKTLKIIGVISLRALVGALLGFVSFLVGDAILLMVGKAETFFWLDWIPWTLFSIAVSAVISFHTEVKFTRALIGGLIAILFSYLFLYFLRDASTSWISYMLYAAGLGGSIFAVHNRAEEYFLRFEYEKIDKRIAIHKWMNVSGGLNRVSVGADSRCTIQMNWDKSNGIADRAVELYINPKDKLPYMDVNADNVTQEGRPIKKGSKIALYDGYFFSIGKTKFTYTEHKNNN